MKNFGKYIFGLLLAVILVNSQAADVQLGAGDVLRIAVYNHPDLSLDVKVSEAGNISYPLLGEVNVAGLPPAAASKKIADLLAKGGFIRDAQVTALVTVMQSQQVSVLGQVNRPGRYPVDGSRNITDIIAMAGGLGTDAADVVTLIRNRNGKSVKETFDLTDMVRSNGFVRDIEVVSSDVIYVERAPHFYIYGEVQRPGTYRLEKNMTVLQALSVGGGLTLRGTERGVRIKRRDATGKMEVVHVQHDDTLQTDDVVYVKESLF